MAFAYSAGCLSQRIREARERAGMSVDEAADAMGISAACLWDIESMEEELTSCYSLGEVKRFCGVLGLSPRGLFGFESTVLPQEAMTLATRIDEHCRKKEISVAEFETRAGWAVAASLAEPARFECDYPIDGIIDVCCELGEDWRRFIVTEPSAS